MSRDEAYPFLVFRDDDVLLGGLTIGQIRRGVAQTATLGYWMGAAHAGRGYMSRAVRAAAASCSRSLRLHRLEAACLPHNTASMQLLTSVGFKREGYARSYLRINGRWQDHVLFALLENDPVLPPTRPIAGRVTNRALQRSCFGRSSSAFEQVLELARLRAPILLGSAHPRAELGRGVPGPARIVQHGPGQRDGIGLPVAR